MKRIFTSLPKPGLLLLPLFLLVVITTNLFGQNVSVPCKFFGNAPSYSHPDTTLHPATLDFQCNDPNLKWYRYKANQDCCGARPLCKKVNIISGFDPNLLRRYRADSLRLKWDTSSFICGVGCVRNEIAISPDCGTNERQTSWYVFDIRPLPFPGAPTAKGSDAGYLRFKIIPCDISPNTNCSGSLTSPACNCARTKIQTSYRDDGLSDFGGSTTDYDWALYKINAFGNDKPKACNGIHLATDTNSPAQKVSCNYSGFKGNTGLFEPGAQGTFTDPDFQNAGGSRYNRPIKVHVGDRFILAVDCFSTTLVGSKIDFSGNGFTTTLTSAQRRRLTLFDSSANVTLPDGAVRLDTIAGAFTPATCDANYVKIRFSRQIYAPNLKTSTFQLSSTSGNPVDSIIPITSLVADSLNDPNYFHDGFTDRYILYTGNLHPGNYLLSQKQVIDDICYTQPKTELSYIRFKIDSMVAKSIFVERNICSIDAKVTMESKLTASYKRAALPANTVFTWKIKRKVNTPSGSVFKYDTVPYPDMDINTPQGRIILTRPLGITGPVGDSVLNATAKKFTIDSIIHVRCVIRNIVSGCTDSNDYSFKVFAPPVVKLSPNPSAQYCFGDKVDISFAKPSDPSYPNRYAYTLHQMLRRPGGISYDSAVVRTVDTASTFPTYSFIADSTDRYVFRGTVRDLKSAPDTGKCFAVSDTITIIVAKPYVAKFDTLSLDSTNGSYPARYKLLNKSYLQYPGKNPQPITEPLVYHWTFGDGGRERKTYLLKDTITHVFTYVPDGNPTHTFTPRLRIEDTIASKVDSGRCEPIYSLPIILYAATIPNIITLNNDGKNDKIQFYGVSRNVNFEVYNRWGKKVYSKDDYDNSFDGHTKDGDELPAGVYFYRMNDTVFPEKSVTKWFSIVK